jgi:hypothetical protein
MRHALTCAHFVPTFHQNGHIKTLPPPPFVIIHYNSTAYGDKRGRITCPYPPPAGYIAEYHAITYDDDGHNLVTV